MLYLLGLIIVIDGLKTYLFLRHLHSLEYKLMARDLNEALSVTPGKENELSSEPTTMIDLMSIPAEKGAEAIRKLIRKN